jgi:4-amino-4-deoxy-L-arabinose transferase-like glycosyltransferase
MTHDNRLTYPSPKNGVTFPALALGAGLLLLTCYPLFFHRLADRDLTSSHEARAAQHAQMMLDTGDWLLPRLFDRRVELQKPPCFYWCVAMLGGLNGGRVDALCVRLPAALAALATVLLLAAQGRRGVVAALLLATMVHFTWLARVGRIDMALTLTVTAALLCFRQPAPSASAGSALTRRSRSGLVLAAGYVILAVGLLLKGPIAVVLPAAVLLAQRLVERRLRWSCVRELGLHWGVPLTLALALPWYAWVEWQTQGELSRVFFWHHNFQRGFGDDDALATHPLWFYGPRLAIDLLPWSLLLPVAAWWFVRRRPLRADPGVRFGLVWLLAVVLLLSLMRFKRADYLLPAYPGAALFLAGVVEHGWRAALQRARLAAAGGVLVAACAAGWVAAVERGLPHHETADGTRSFALAIRQRTAGRVVFFRTEAHALAFHVGRPVITLLEWENLDTWLAKGQPLYVLMPFKSAAEWPAYLHNGRLEEVERRDRLGLVLLRYRPSP